MFILFVVILTFVCGVVFNGVSSLASILLSFIVTLLIFYGYSGGYDGLLVTLGIKPGVYGLGGYGPGAYSLPV